jgi:mitochondrial fission protein ELM1
MTHPPTPDQVAVATSALRSEAKVWDTESGEMAKLSTKVAAMEFGRLEAGLFQLMVSPYNDVVHAVADRSKEGATAMAEIAGTLRSVADTYDAEDRAAEHRIRNIY